MTDVIDRLAGLDEGSAAARLRLRRPQARDNAEASYRALFEPAEPGDVTPTERFAVAAFVGGLHAEPTVQAFYGEGLATRAPDLVGTVEAEAARGRAEGPYGRFPPGTLSVEDAAGPIHRVGEAARSALGARLAAALEHAHLLVFRPRDASPEALGALLEAGWSTTGVVTLSQLVAFLSFQIRVAAGLRVLAASGAGEQP